VKSSKVWAYAKRHEVNIQWKERETKKSAAEIKVMTHALLVAPTHPGKQLKRFKDVSEYDHQQACGAK
jgi:hypothetical protein